MNEGGRWPSSFDGDHMKYIVRDNYAVRLGKDVYHGGEVVELTEQQAADYANIIEPVVEKPARKAKAAE